MREEKCTKNCRVKNLMVNFFFRFEKVLGFFGRRRGVVSYLFFVSTVVLYFISFYFVNLGVFAFFICFLGVRFCFFMGVAIEIVGRFFFGF